MTARPPAQFLQATIHAANQLSSKFPPHLKRKPKIQLPLPKLARNPPSLILFHATNHINPGLNLNYTYRMTRLQLFWQQLTSPPMIKKIQLGFFARRISSPNLVLNPPPSRDNSRAGEGKKTCKKWWNACLDTHIGIILDQSRYSSIGSSLHTIQRVWYQPTFHNNTTLLCVDWLIVCWLIGWSGFSLFPFLLLPIKSPLIQALFFSHILLPIFLWTAAFDLGKDLSVVVGVCESGFLSDFHDAVAGT